VSKKSGKFLPRLDLQTEVVPAQLLNEAGIVGAALAHTESTPASHAD
jgi:polyphosphate glucokinase